MPNLLIIYGSGQNVGKTTLACKIIEDFSRNTDLYAIKISPHFHDVENGNCIYNSKEIQIYNELSDNTLKDSSKFLLSGASKVFYIQVFSDKVLEKHIGMITKIIGDTPCVCESGGLIQYVKPGVSIFCNVSNSQNAKPSHSVTDTIISDYKFTEINIKLNQNIWSIC